MAHLRRRAPSCTPRKPSGRDGGGDKSQRLCSPSTWSPELLGHWEGTKRWPNQVCASEEYLNLNGLDLGSAQNPGLASDSSWQSNLEPKQGRQEKHTRRERGQTQCSRDTASTCQCYLFAVSLPPHSTTEQVSLKKCPPPPPCVRAEIRH